MRTICHKCRKSKHVCSCPTKRRKNKNMRRWYSTARWARLRMYIGQRDMWLCQQCKREGREEAGNEIDHIERAAEREERFWDPSNLQVLCRKCHGVKTKQEGLLR